MSIRKVSMPMVSIRQVKAARALLGWSQTELARRSGISEPTIKRLEAADGHNEIGGRAETADAIKRALEAAGVEFTNGGAPGVKLVASLKCPKCSARVTTTPEEQDFSAAVCGLGHRPSTECPEYKRIAAEARSRISQALLRGR
jgi:transcriptional regulator with XRE-family HTH domain